MKYTRPGWRTRVLGDNVRVLSITLAFAVLFLGFSVTSPVFLTVDNLAQAARQVAPTVVVGVAMTFVITSGGIDLSVGSLAALCGASLALLAGPQGPVLALVQAVALGAVSGLVLGYVSSYHQVPAFIATLAGLTAIRGIAQLVTNGYSTPIEQPVLTYLGSGRILGVYVSTWIAAVFVALGAYVFSHTKYGRHLTAVGSNEESARRCGVDARRVKLMTFLGTGVAAAVAGILMVTRLRSGSSNIGVAFELEAITAVVLGGTSLAGGRGSIYGTTVGALTLGVLSNGLVLVGLNVYWVPILQGVILLVAVLANSKLYARMSSRK